MARSPRRLVRGIAAMCLLIASGLGLAGSSRAEERPQNNPVGINVARLSQERFVGAVGGLVNTNGGDWGYMTITWTVEDRDSSQSDWILQQFLDRCYEYHLNPIIRVGTWHDASNEIWERPTEDEPRKWRAFLERGKWGSQTVYIVVGNEPNLGFEWGGEVDPAGYARYLESFMNAFADSDRFKIVNAPLDASNWTELPKMLDEFEFIEGMRAAVPDIFERLPAWASNPYRVPSAGEQLRYTHLAYEAELDAIGRDMPVIITESGLMETEDQSAIADFFERAFHDWMADPKVVAATPLFWNPHTNDFWMFRPNPDGSVSLASETYRRIAQLPKPRGSPNYRPTLGNVPRGGATAAIVASGTEAPTEASSASSAPSELEALAPEPTVTPMPPPTSEPTATTPPPPPPEPTATPEPTMVPTARPTDTAALPTSTPVPSRPAAEGPPIFPTGTPSGQAPPIVAARAQPAPTVYIPPVPPAAIALPGVTGPAAAAGRYQIGNTDGAGANVRAAPHPEAEKVAGLDEGDVVEAFADEREGGERRWRRIRTAEGVEGWVVVEVLVPLDEGP